MNVVEDRTQIYVYISMRPNQHCEDKHDTKSVLKTNKCEDYAIRTPLKHTKQEFGGGVTHRIGTIRPRHDAQLSWHSKVKFRINVFTLRVYVSID